KRQRASLHRIFPRPWDGGHPRRRCPAGRPSRRETFVEEATARFPPSNLPKAMGWMASAPSVPGPVDHRDRRHSLRIDRALASRQSSQGLAMEGIRAVGARSGRPSRQETFVEERPRASLQGDEGKDRINPIAAKRCENKKRESKT